MTTRCPCCGFELKPVEPLEIAFVSETGQVSHRGRSCVLPPRQLDVLEHLIDAYPKAIPLAQILVDLYGVANALKRNQLLVNIGQMRGAFRSAGMTLTIATHQVEGPNAAHHYALRVLDAPLRSLISNADEDRDALA